MKNTYYFLQLLILVLFCQCYTTPKLAGQFTAQEFDEMALQMAEGTVPDITPQELVKLKEEVILLDARELEEYQVSHIPNAIWVGYDDFTLDRVKDLSKTATIVTYCSVGYRSERIGEKLQKAGFENVNNLKGSIFRWMNEGYPVVNMKALETDEVHGFNKKWGKWVKKGKGKVVYDGTE